MTLTLLAVLLLAQDDIGHWSYDEGSGDAADDPSPLNNDGLLLGGGRAPAWSADIPPVPFANPWSLWFDGSDDGVHSDVSRYHSTTNTFTIAFWAKPELARDSTAESAAGTAGYSSQQRFANFPAPFGASSGLGHVGAGVSVGTNGVSVFEWEQMGHFPSLLVHDAPVAGWVHVAVVFSAKQPTLYLDGVAVRTGLTSTKTLHPSSLVGRKGDASFGAYGGWIDEVHLFNRALAPDEIVALAARGSTPSPTPSPSPSPSIEPAMDEGEASSGGACGLSSGRGAVALFAMALAVAALKA